MKQGIFEIRKNTALNPGTYRMVLSGDISAVTAPGQFINIKLDGLFLRRPISICDYDETQITIIYKVVGKGTEQMCRMVPGDTLDVLSGLGNGFDTAQSGQRPVLLGGGVGTAPLYHLAKDLLAQGKEVTAVLGFNTAGDVFYEREFQALGCRTIVTTADGSRGLHGFVTAALPELDYTYFYACGPEPMLKAVHKAADCSGQLSFEERMGCGFGACMGCSCKTLTGYKRICKDGPVLKKEEILWES